MSCRGSEVGRFNGDPTPLACDNMIGMVPEKQTSLSVLAQSQQICYLMQIVQGRRNWGERRGAPPPPNILRGGVGIWFRPPPVFATDFGKWCENTMI